MRHIRLISCKELILHKTGLSRLILCAAFLAGTAFWVPSLSKAQYSTRTSEARAEVGEPVPSFKLSSLRDSSRTYGPSDFEGRYLLLNLWATWCAPCIEKIPTLKRIRDRYDEETLAVLNISFDDSRETAKTFLENRSIPGKHAYVGGKGGQPALVSSFGNSFAAASRGDRSIRGLPNVTLVGPDGEVLARLLPHDDGLTDEVREHLPGPTTDKGGGGAEKSH